MEDMGNDPNRETATCGRPALDTKDLTQAAETPSASVPLGDQAGTASDTPFNHYSLLKTLENIFDTDGYLGYASAPGLVPFFGCVTSDIAVKDGDQTAHCNLR